jgi:hypothetical protein
MKKLTVGELRQILEDIPDEAEVCIADKYGNVDGVDLEHLERIEGTADRLIIKSSIIDYFLNRRIDQ